MVEELWRSPRQSVHYTLEDAAPPAARFIYIVNCARICAYDNCGSKAVAAGVCCRGIWGMLPWQLGYVAVAAG
eukprot:474073-Pleurochrysis_carterae.AAC.1